jgi:ABC-type transport system involved in multi-copper enzyme maturation permease subunit
MFSTTTILVGAVLVLIQLLAALPWLALAFVSRRDLAALARKPFAPWVLSRVGVALACAVVLPMVFLTFVQDQGSLEVSGRVYAGVLQLQLTVDAFIFGFLLLLAVWPKGGAVALAAFREGVRQWMFWLLVLLAAGFMFVSIFIPYFTFGEDYLMVKQIGYDLIMLFAALFGALAASMSISEEIEGRTAVTLMSKPVSRRQFLLGKFVGIALAGLLMFGLLGTFFEAVLLLKHWWERLTPLNEVAAELTQESTRIGVVATPAWVIDTLKAWALPGAATDFLRGIGQWTAHALDTLPGLVLGFSQVMVLIAVAVTLATRVPMVVNLPTVLGIYFAANLTRVLLAKANQRSLAEPNSPVTRLLGFVAQVFDTVLPDLASFRLDPALLSDVAPPAALLSRYVASVSLYGIVYTGIVLLFGLILFEDRDLA